MRARDGNATGPRRVANVCCTARSVVLGQSSAIVAVVHSSIFPYNRDTRQLTPSRAQHRRPDVPVVSVREFREQIVFPVVGRPPPNRRPVVAPVLRRQSPRTPSSALARRTMAITNTVGEYTRPPGHRLRTSRRRYATIVPHIIRTALTASLRRPRPRTPLRPGRAVAAGLLPVFCCRF